MSASNFQGVVANTASTPPLAPPKTWTEPIHGTPWTRYQRITFSIRVWIFQKAITLALSALRLVKSHEFRKIAPTMTKRYPVRPMLEHRIFLPPNYTPGMRLPLYLDIHGGGFALCDPATDDEFCHNLAKTYGYCVISLDYRKSPQYQFPCAVHDLGEVVRAVLADEDLPIDHTRVVLGGFSAGGNLSLAVAQLDGIQEKLKAVVPVYPVVDFSGKYAGEMKTNPEGKKDMLLKTAKLFNWAYVPDSVDRRDKLLSPIFATREDLPQKMYFVGAEHDYLCYEANFMARCLAGIEGEADLGFEWDKGGIRWETVPNQRHGFTHVAEKGEREAERKEICEDLYDRIHTWLKKEVFEDR